MESKKETNPPKESNLSKKEEASSQQDIKPPRQITEKEKKEFLNQIRN